MKINFTDLSDCQLMQVPDAVYHLMRHTDLNSCDLSNNVITKIPPKLAIKFSTITGKNKKKAQLLLSTINTTVLLMI